MSLVPAWEIGVWNAWIFMVCSLIPVFFLFMPLVARGKEGETDFTVNFSKMQKRAFSTNQLIYFLVVIYSIFVPLKSGTVWFYAGLPVFLVAFIPYIVMTVNFVATPLDQPVTTGIYRYSRHPSYLLMFLVLLGTGIATASWIILLVSVISKILTSLFAVAEERHCLEKYGEAYRKYLERTPRWIGLPKS